MSEVGKRIKKLRKSLKISQKELASMANVSQSGISDIETSTRSPSIDTLQKIAAAMNVPLSELTGEEKEAPASGESLEQQIIFQVKRLPPSQQADLLSYARYLVNSADKT